MIFWDFFIVVYYKATNDWLFSSKEKSLSIHCIEIILKEVTPMHKSKFHIYIWNIFIGLFIKLYHFCNILVIKCVTPDKHQRRRFTCCALCI